MGGVRGREKGEQGHREKREERMVGRKGWGSTSGVGIPVNVFLDFKFVSAGLVLRNDPADDGHAALFDLLLVGVEVILEVAEADLGYDGRAGLGNELVFSSECCEQALPACNNFVFVALDQAEFEVTEAVR